MNKYIPAETLIAELIGFRDIAREKIDDEDNYFLGMAQGYDNAIDIITSLQQESAPSKEEVVDRIADWISRNPDFFFNGDTKEVMNEIKKLV